MISCFTPSFWWDVLYAWSIYNYVHEPKSGEILTQHLWYNSRIRVANKPIPLVNAFKDGLQYLVQLVDSEKGVTEPSELSVKVWYHYYAK